MGRRRYGRASDGVRLRVPARLASRSSAALAAARSDSRTIFTQSRITPANAPSARIATGVKTAISASENFVTQVPTSQTASTTTIIGSTSLLSTARGYPSAR